MWSIKYKGLYIQGHVDSSACQVLESSSGLGYEWRAQCKSQHAAKLAITRRLKGQTGVR